jgi:hypothetical protein
MIPHLRIEMSGTHWVDPGHSSISDDKIRSMSDANDPLIWKIIFLSGCGVIAACFGALCNYAISTNIIGDHLELYFSAIGAGLVCLIVGAIGWAIKLGRQKSKKLALTLFFLPVGICFLAVLMNANVHITLPMIVFVSIPVCLLGLVMLVISVWK